LDRAVAEDWLGKWAMNLMLINVSTRKFRRAVRLPEGGGNSAGENVTKLVNGLIPTFGSDRRGHPSQPHRPRGNDPSQREQPWTRDPAAIVRRPQLKLESL
jgi:hypothetical protein